MTDDYTPNATQIDSEFETDDYTPNATQVDNGFEIDMVQPLPDNLQPEFGVYRCGFSEVDARSK